MEFIFSKVVRLKTLRAEKSRLSEEETDLSKPVLEDRSLISGIYQEFESLLGVEDSERKISRVYRRRMFILIILYLYDPSSLAGGKLLSGLRDEISRVLGVSSACTVSNNSADVVFMYQNCKEFREGVDSLFSKLMDRVELMKSDKNERILNKS